MLSAEGKAKELVDRMLEIQLVSNKLNHPNVTREIAKQSVIIAIEFAQERINKVSDNIFSDSTDATNNEWKYLEEVKQEIEKL